MIATAVMADEAVLMSFMHRPKISTAMLIVQMITVPATKAVLI